MRGRWWTLLAAPAIMLSSLATLTACDEAEAPEGTPPPSATEISGAAIVIETPREGESVGSPVAVRGTASVFEGTVQLVVKDGQGKTLGKVTAQASEGAPGRGRFEAQVPFTPPSEEGEGRIEAYWESPKDGSPQDLVAVSVVLLPATGSTSPGTP